MTDSQGNPLTVRIVGIVTNSQQQDSYWVESPDEFDTELLVAQEIFEQNFLRGGKVYEYNTRWHIQFDPDSIEYPNAKHIVEKT